MPLSMFSKVEDIKGVGPKTREIMEKSGIYTFRDLLYYLPRTYENFTNTTKLSEIRPGKVVVRGKISDLRIIRTNRRNFTIVEGVIHDETDAIRVVWFNQVYRAKQFDPDKVYYFTGTYDYSRNRYQLTSPKAQLASDVENAEGSENGFKPVYSMKGSFKSENFKRIFETLRPEFAFIPDLLPMSESAPDFVKPGARADALFKAHFAEDDKEVKAARKYLAYEELFELILAANLNKKENQKLRAPVIPFTPEKIHAVVEKLPFDLTGAQRRAAFEILKDLEKNVPMNRLLQGDVGSGKTVVAALAAFEAVQAGYQVALLAPTAILATQHAESLNELLSPFGVTIGLLTGATKRKDELKKRIKDGKVDLIVGTHALITDDTEFNRLALCIIDEQHRFGVNQRQKLLAKTVESGMNEARSEVPSISRTRESSKMESSDDRDPEKFLGREASEPMNPNLVSITKPLAPHLLMMTATPIPRSLQLAIFGDLDVSILNELPKGRQPVNTKIIREIDFTDELYPKVREYLKKGQQVYWICRKIEDKGSSEVISVKKQTKKLKEIFPKEEIAFLHGKMKTEEKEGIMSDFAKGKIQILVSTTVVEVGVNVPNANLMVIMDADGYGLAQLHQLRGRVGRGKEAAICYLVSPGESEPARRLKELEKSTDGFYLAEADLKIRGPGEIYGSLQHGAMSLQFASLTSTKLISAAGAEAKACAEEFAKNPEKMKDYPELSFAIKKYQQLTTLN
ncbi:ATP-dependent DNA helicase RecG [Candidatus Saccharibacteria bacterium]|nr:ATP-dependent DNA helicase RecG [Candidatus Saccharibacteria bacterium]